MTGSDDLLQLQPCFCNFPRPEHCLDAFRSWQGFPRQSAGRAGGGRGLRQTPSRPLMHYYTEPLVSLYDFICRVNILRPPHRACRLYSRRADAVFIAAQGKSRASTGARPALYFLKSSLSNCPVQFGAAYRIASMQVLCVCSIAFAIGNELAPLALNSDVKFMKHFFTQKFARGIINCWRGVRKMY